MTTTDAEWAIEASGLTKHFGDRVAVADLALAVAENALCGLLGPDGAGKTTTIRMLATVLAATSGDAQIFGHSVTRHPGRVTPLIGYMPQKFSMYPDLTVAENVDFFATIRGVPKAGRRARAAELLERMGLGPFARRRARDLSGGMKQKLMLTSVLMHSPRVLLLDEPTTGVDPVSRHEFWEILAELRASGATVLVATPYMDEAERCSDLVFLDAGQVRHHGTPAQIKALVAGDLYEAHAPDPRAALAALASMLLVTSCHLFGDVVRVLVPAGTADAGTQLRTALRRAGVDATVTPAEIDMETAFAAIAEQEHAPLGLVGADASTSADDTHGTVAPHPRRAEP